MEYYDYKVEDFITDESFQRYCLNQDEDDIRFWNNWKADYAHKQFEMEEAEHFVRSMQWSDSPRNYFDYALRKQVIREQIQEKIKGSNKQPGV
ncbi:MAG TPA: hypothetical protein VFW11_01105 [Cyclobacteriaceae bacterium]|nr:hypothetical protein [Cyclobacteriaceae bacterium]